MLPLIAVLASGLCLTSSVLARDIHLRNRINHRRIGQLGRRDEYEGSDSDSDSLPKVPTYNFSMPVDHFDHSGEKTYPNRFFVNDTFYQAGGPVIFYDFGEAGVDPLTLAQTLSEYGGQTSSAMALASELHGLVIGWEHRYYGYSQPVKMDNEFGFPVEGPDGYKYLTVEQSIEDVAYFANSFNRTKLPLNQVNSTATLDPYNTPWIFIGASYPGSRAAWMRAKHPEIIYASWASSAPLQSQFDGSIYINPLVRALPKNCSSDVEAAIRYNDDILTAGSASDQEFVSYAAGAVYSAIYGSDRVDPEEVRPYNIGEILYQGLTFSGNYQYFGATGSVQIMCDAMESFDTDEFFETYSDKDSDSDDKVESILDNSADETPPSKGIAASARSEAGLGTFAALVYGMNVSLSEIMGHYKTGNSSSYITPFIDEASWQWQTVSEVGWFQGSNDSHAFRVISKFANTTAVRESYVDYFGSGGPSKSKVPDQINNTYLLDVGGWNAKISNVMFTNGEFDPWRAFSVASQETEDGAPGRNVTRVVPKCNEVGQGTDVFGLIYPGEVHGSDISVMVDSSSSNGTTRPPPEVGLELFLKAWKVWEPCFQKSRDDVRNGKGVDGQGNDASGKDGKQGKDSASSRMEPGGLLPLLFSSSLIMGLFYI